MNKYQRQFEFQKEHWSKELKKWDWNNDTIYGNQWGDPSKSDGELGNYLYVKERLQKLVTSNSIILEIGSLAGKWVQFLLHANYIWCVDIDTVGFDYIKHKFQGLSVGLAFYKTPGNNLHAVPSSSVDLVYSMDSLVRTNPEWIYQYIKESYRVLKTGGRTFIHLPFDEKEMCVKKNFTVLNRKMLEFMVDTAGFNDWFIDEKTLNHGIILEAIKSA